MYSIWERNSGLSALIARSTLNGTGPGDVYRPDAPVSGRYLPPLEILFLLLAISLYGLRIYGRVIMLKSGGIDDVFAGIALIFAVAVTALHLSAVSWGLGHRTHDLNIVNAEKLLHSELVNQWLFPLAQLFTKLSILTFYRCFMSRKYRIFVYITMGFVVAWTMGISTAISLSCTPVNKFWMYEGKGTCWTPQMVGALYFSQVALNLISDVIVFVLPISTVRQLPVSNKEKVRMLVLLGLNVLICIIALVRIKLIGNWLFSSEDDQPWYLYNVYTSMGIEVDLAIAVACLPFCIPVATAIKRNGSVKALGKKLKNINLSRAKMASRCIRVPRLRLPSKPFSKHQRSDSTECLTGSMDKAFPRYGGSQTNEMEAKIPATTTIMVDNVASEVKIAPTPAIPAALVPDLEKRKQVTSTAGASTGLKRSKSVKKWVQNKLADIDAQIEAGEWEKNAIEERLKVLGLAKM